MPDPTAVSAPTLAEWLTERLDEDERVAREVEVQDGARWSSAVHVGDYINTSVVTDVPASKLQPSAYDGDLVLGNGDSVIARCGQDYDGGKARAEHIARHDPARVLADVAAKRRIVSDVQRVTHHDPLRQGDYWRGVRDAAEGYLRLLSLPYASAPGYRDEWAP